MPLKSVLTSLDGLSDELRAHYVERDGKHYLDIEALDDHHAVGALRRAKEHEKKLRQDAETNARNLEEQLRARDTEIEGLRTGAVPKADVEALRKSYDEKLNAEKSKFTDQYTKLNSLVERHVIDGAATKLAAEISTAPDLLLPHIRSRLKLETVNDEFTISILGSDGKPTANSLEDLRKELLSNKAFAPILIGSKASGSGASGGSGRGGASSKKLSDMSEQERVQFQREDPEGFQNAIKEMQKASARF
jgi:hypothetical protein